MRSTIFAALGAATLMMPSLTLGATPAERTLWRQDYALLKTEMERSYSHLAWFASARGGVNIPLLDQRTRAALEQAHDETEARVAMRDFVTGFHDGHFAELPRVERAAAVPTVEPSQRDVSKDEPMAGCAALGFGERSQVGFSLPFESLPEFVLEADGASTAFRAGIVTVRGKSIGILRIKNFSERQYATECIRAWIDHPEVAKSSAAFMSLVTDQWFASLAKQLTRFKAEDVQVVLVDIGSNSGGNDSGDWAARLFATRPLASARLFMAAAPIVGTYLDEEVGEAQAARSIDPALESVASRSLDFFRMRKAAIESRYCNMSWVWRGQRTFAPEGCSRLLDVGFASGAFNALDPVDYHERQAAAKIYWPEVVGPLRGAWNGRTYVLTNAATYSAAEMFAAVMRDNGVAKIVGTHTGGDGCGFMADAPPVVLPHLQLRFRLPNCVRLRADGTDEVAGIEPDILVAATDNESPRARALRLLVKVWADTGL